MYLSREIQLNIQIQDSYRGQTLLHYFNEHIVETYLLKCIQI